MLKGDKVALRALEPSDAESLHGWHADHEFSVLDGVPYPTTLSSWEEFVREANTPSWASVTFAIEAETAELVGYVALKRVRSEARSAEFGIAIAREHWGKGFGRDATEIILRFAFGEMNLHRVSMEVADYNERGRRLYKACGFKEEGRMRDARFRDGRYCDNIVMSILYREFLQLHPIAEMD